MTRPSPEDLRRVARAFQEQRRRDEEFRRTYGHVRPTLHLELPEGRIVAVGSSLYGPGPWSTLHDFLFDHIKGVLGGDWGAAEQQKPYEERHPIMQWNDALAELAMAKASEDAGIVPHGPAQAYLTLAYDLLILQDYLFLRERLIERLKHRDQFQGARYELFTTASFVRGGFDLTLEDEDDPTTRHCEFTATHRDTGQAFSVECKSRHRPGVLGFQNSSTADRTALKAGLRSLLRNALQKPATHPLVVFLDVNLPPEFGSHRAVPWLREIAETLEAEMSEGGTYPWGLVVVTNHPYHYGRRDEEYPREQAFIHVPKESAVATDHPEAIQSIIESIQQFGRVPSDFHQSQTVVK